MKKKFSNALMMTAITALLSASYASAATVNVTVHNDEKNPNSMTLRPGGSLHIPFPGSAGSHKIPNVPNRVYPTIGITFQGQGQSEPITYRCRTSNFPGAPFLKKIDLDGNDKSFSLIAKYNATTGRVSCYEAGGY